jgi:hypothetical protein
MYQQAYKYPSKNHGMLHSFLPDGSQEAIVLALVSAGNSERISNSANTGNRHSLKPLMIRH